MFEKYLYNSTKIVRKKRFLQNYWNIHLSIIAFRSLMYLLTLSIPSENSNQK